MIEDKKVSIILCFYNEEKYLAQAIDSVLAQTYHNFELIIINDGSTDGSDAIIKQYSDERIIYRINDENRRLAYSRNRGLELATGDYIGFFDGDDIMIPDKIARQVKYLDEHEDTIVVSGGYVYMDSEGYTDDKIVEPECLSDEQIRAYMLFGNCIAVGAALFRRKIIDNYKIRLDEKNKASEDYRFWVDVLPYGKFANINGVFYQYRINHGSKANLIVKSNVEVYDEEVKQILRDSWAARGFSIGEKDIEFIYYHLFEGRRTLNPRSVIQGMNIYRKIKGQSKQNKQKDKDLILKYYKRCWLRNYHIYWLLKRFTNIIGKRV